MANRFNTDTKALGIREILNQKAAVNLEDWMSTYIPLQKDWKILDIGCGRGKQVFYFEKLISDKGSILGVDASQDAIDTVSKEAIERGLKNVSAKKLLIDEIPETLIGEKYNLITSTYAIYYSSNLPQLLINLKPLLAEKGQIFICGFGKDSNKEIIDLINSITGTDLLPASPDFIAENHIKDISTHYSNCEIYRLENKIVFDSAADLLAWWKNHNSYLPEIESEVVKRLNEYFSHNKQYSLSKNVLAIQFSV